MRFLSWSTWFHTGMCFPFRCVVVVLIVWMTLNVVSLRRHHWYLYLFWIVVIALLTKISRLETKLVLTLEPPLFTGCMHLSALIINNRLWVLLQLLSVLRPLRVEMHPLLWVALSPTENAIIAAFERRFTYSRVLIAVLEYRRPIRIDVIIIVWTLLSYDAATRIGLQGVMQWLGGLIWIAFGCSFNNLFSHVVSAVWCVFIAVNIYFTKLI